MESRPYDSYYDPVYTTRANPGRRSGRPLYRAVDSSAQAVSGKNRAQFFRRPIVPFLHSVPPEVMLAPVPTQSSGGGVTDPLAAPAPVSTEPTRTVGMQTAFRESEAQTDPYTPDFTVRPGDDPELLTLEGLTFGKGLPATSAEVLVIERARNKRRFEAMLPPTTDEASFELRRRMMEKQEMTEWRAREAEIDRIQAQRLALLEKAVYEREREREFLAEQRVEALRQQRLEEKERAVAAIQRERIKALRKISKARKIATQTHEPRDIVGDYHDFGSSVYAPIRREGATNDEGIPNEAVKAGELRSLNSLYDLQNSISRSTLEARVSVPKLGPEGLPVAERRNDTTIASHLSHMDSLIKSGMFGRAPQKEILQPSWKQRAKRTARPPTPTCEAISEDEGEKERALLLLQKLIRGRAVQNFMYEGKERRAALIRELRMDQEDAEEERGNEEARREGLAAVEVEQAVAATQEALQGEVVSATLDYLSKELVRRQEEERIAEGVADAERTRRMREAEESGRRQVDEAKRAQKDEVFTQLMETHQGTAESYVDEVTAETIANVATETAEREAAVANQTLGPALGGVEAEGNEDGVVVRDLVASFLIPEVDRRAVREQIELEEKRYVHAAQAAISEVTSSVANALNEDRKVAEEKVEAEGKKESIGV